MNSTTETIRPPVIAVLGHIDHGKSSLLDYIRKTNVVDSEAGGITQHISSYEVIHPTDSGERAITFLDTPGHAAFSSVRSQSIKAADIAILIVSAEDGVKPQTLEAYESIKSAELPFLVAINKIDKEGANIERTKQSLAEHGIYIEEYGGPVPAVNISAKQGTGMSELLDTILLQADLEELKGDPDQPAEGVVLESDIDPKKGIRATLIIKNGTLRKGMAVTAGQALCPVRMMFSFRGESLDEARYSSPIDLVGWDNQPAAGDHFLAHQNKKVADQYRSGQQLGSVDSSPISQSQVKTGSVPVIIKADTSGSLSAIKKEIKKLEDEQAVFVAVIDSGLGSVTENDIRNATITEGTAVIGFNVTIDPTADRVKEQCNVVFNNFQLIYELTDWLAEYVEINRPRSKVETATGVLKVLKTFSRVKNNSVIGGRVETGELSVNDRVKIKRGEAELGQGRIKELQQQKVSTQSVTEGAECGLMVESPIEVTAGDIIESFTINEV